MWHVSPAQSQAMRGFADSGAHLAFLLQGSVERFRYLLKFQWSTILFKADTAIVHQNIIFQSNSEYTYHWKSSNMFVYKYLDQIESWPSLGSVVAVCEEPSWNTQRRRRRRTKHNLQNSIKALLVIIHARYQYWLNRIELYIKKDTRPAKRLVKKEKKKIPSWDFITLAW